jgi:wyosine [tRNA(Phe)-imidazoG37] synthetase (radical SAM superfamily)
VFGPVPSRRLGRSLGVDLLPPKICSLDCVYCQVARTTCHTLERSSHVDPAAVLAEVRGVLESGRAVDAVTFSGTGEPTLSLDLGPVLRGLPALGTFRKVVITNGTLLWRSDVRADLATADLVIPTLDTATEASFAAVHRPAPGLTLARHLEGLEAFSTDFAGEIWLEVMLVAGLNDADAEVLTLAGILGRLRVARVQLNTVVRPPAERGGARPVPPDRMAAIAARLSQNHPHVEIIGHFASEGQGAAGVTEADLVQLLERHPDRPDDVARALDTSLERVQALVAPLLAAGRLRVDEGGCLRVVG